MAKGKAKAKPEPKGKATKAKADPKATEKKKSPIPRGRKGKTWGLTTGHSWHKVMLRNSREKLSDTEIAEFMQSEFPENKKYTVNDVAMHRTLFNKGKIKGHTDVPEKLLVQYDDDGKPMAARGEKSKAAKAKKDAKAKKEDVPEKVDLEDDDDDDDSDDDDDDAADDTDDDDDDDDDED